MSAAFDIAATDYYDLFITYCSHSTRAKLAEVVVEDLMAAPSSPDRIVLVSKIDMTKTVANTDGLLRIGTPLLQRGRIAVTLRQGATEPTVRARCFGQ
jgi:hypothetical protein